MASVHNWGKFNNLSKKNNTWGGGDVGERTPLVHRDSDSAGRSRSRSPNIPVAECGDQALYICERCGKCDRCCACTAPVPALISSASRDAAELRRTLGREKAGTIG